MPVRQPNPAPAVNWPVQSGLVPPLAAQFSSRPETGFGAPPGQPADLPGSAAGAREAGSYVLVGPGGTGKTQLAAAYARSRWESGEIDLLIWITASSRAALLTGYAQACREASRAPGGPVRPEAGPGGTSPQTAVRGGLAAAPGYGSGADQEQAASRLLRWLADSTRSWLVVLDDVVDPADLAGLWPRGAMGAAVLTTRLPPASLALPGPPATVVPIGPFSRREALSFLTARLYEDTAQRNGALDLAETLGCLPIALAQGAAFIADSRIDCRDYRGQFSERRQAMGIAPDSGHAATVAVTWSLVLDRTDELLPFSLARPLLALLALLDPHGVPAAVLTSKATREYIGSYRPDRAPATDQEIFDVLSGLEQVGLLTIDPANAIRTVYVHALVQACVRQVLPDMVRDQAAAAAAGSVLQAWPDRSPDAHLDQALRDAAATLTMTAPEFMWSPAGRPLLRRAGQSLDAARLSGPAIAYWQAMVEASGPAAESPAAESPAAAASEPDEGPGGPALLEYLQLLASAYETADRTDLAIDVRTALLTRWEEQAGPGHPQTLTARGQLARMCVAADRVPEAIPLFEQTLAGREWVLGPDHPDTLAARSDLAAAYRAGGRINDAIIVFRRTLTDQELVLGDDHPATVTTRGSLAAALHAAGRMPDAIPLYVRTLADRERVLGPDHPDTLTSRANLAYAYRSIGKVKNAIPLYVRTLADRERVLGPDHPDTLTSRANLAAAYHHARKLKDAIPLYERTLAGRERVQGPDHPDTLTARGNLASAYHSAGRLVVATELYEKTLADYERVLGPQHENTLTSRANLAMAYHAARRSTNARALLRRTLSDCEQALPPGHPLTGSVRESLDAANRTWAWSRPGHDATARDGMRGAR